jgi:muramoyltetrapeptide carboxypeptidase
MGLRPTKSAAARVHLLCHANPAGPDVRRLGFADLGEYMAFIRRQLGGDIALTYSRRLFEATEDQNRGGRRDDELRIRDLQGALDDPRTVAIIAVSGGGYFSRILPHVDFSPIARRRAPLWAFGFSEMTTLVNIVASYPQGRGVYWLCPNYLAWKIRPARAARAAFGEFWRMLPSMLGGSPRPDGPGALVDPRLRLTGRLVAGSVASDRVRLAGGCLSVLAAFVGGRLGRRVRPDGRWLAIEDINEAPYRIDRWLAALKLAGWFDRMAGVLVGDFHTKDDRDQSAAVGELLRFHLPPQRRLPVVLTRDFGHVWPMAPLSLNRPLELRVRGGRVEIVQANSPTGRVH